MSVHTPGPWGVYEGNEVIAPCNEHLNCHKTIVFGVRTMKGMEELQCSSGVNTEANARLIAAAPDMLEALRGVAIVLLYGSSLFDGEPWLRRVADAIKKAEGAK